MSRIKKILVLCCFIMPLLSVAQKELQFNSPPSSPALFGNGVISTGLRERDFALSPDGTELFYTLQSPLGIFQTILYRQKNSHDKWSEPEIAPFAGRFSDLEPAFTSDGKRLFFSSNRPLTGDSIKDFDIWFVEKKNGEWGKAQNIGAPVNTPADEYYPSITASGNLYFTASYDKAAKEDIYKATWEKGKYTTIVPLDSAINSRSYEFNAYVSPDEQLIIFTSYGRKDDKGRGDLYMSIKNKTGQWQPAINMLELNSDKIDYCPFVSFDKKILFFTSERTGLVASYPAKHPGYHQLATIFNSAQNGGGDIYWVDFLEIIRRFKFKSQN